MNATKLRTGERHPVTRGVIDPSEPSAEPFRSLRLALELRDSHQTSNIVVFTSANPGEGKSTIASNYAVVAAIVHHGSVLLVDADLRSPSLHTMFGTQRAPGFVEAVAGETAHDVTHRVRGFGSLDLLTAGGRVASSGDFMSSQRVKDFLTAASREHHLVVVDTPPILSASDAATIATTVGANVVLVVDKSSRRRAVARALHALELVHANVVGIVMNREGSLAQYGYGYGN